MSGNCLRGYEVWGSVVSDCGVWGCGVPTLGVWARAGGPWCVVVRPPLHLLYFRGWGEHQKLKDNGWPPSISFWMLMLWSEKLIDILNIKTRQRSC